MSYIEEDIDTEKYKEILYLKLPIEKKNSDIENNIVIETNSNQQISIITEKIKDEVNKKLNNQDFMQRFYISINILFELYRLLSSSLLILFVPQNCKGEVCSLKQNIYTDDTDDTFNISFKHFYYVALSFNFFTLAAFLVLYRTEIIRENRLIKYLDVNNELPTDDTDVKKILEILPIEKKNKIISIDKKYKLFGYISIVIFIINVIFSSIIVYTYYLDSQTTTTMITYILFIFYKLLNVYNVANTNKHTFYSAYLKSNIQYNDIDRKFKNVIKE